MPRLWRASSERNERTLRAFSPGPLHKVLGGVDHVLEKHVTGHSGVLRVVFLAEVKATAVPGMSASEGMNINLLFRNNF